MARKLYELLLAASLGDGEAAMEVMDVFAVQLNAYSRKIDGDDTRQDLQEFLLCFINKYANRMKGMPDKVILAYISRSLKHYCFKLYEKYKLNMVNQPVAFEIPHEVDFTTGLLLREAFRVLTDKEKQVIFSVYYADVPIRDMAEKRGVSVQSIHNIKNRALRKMKEFIQTSTPL